MFFDGVVQKVDNQSHDVADRLLFEIRSSWCRGPCNAHRAWCVSLKTMFWAITALTEGWKDSLVATALGEGVIE